MNIAIIILKLVFMIHERRDLMLLDQLEAIEQYCYRHLNEPETYRSFIFIKLLLQIPQRNFNPDDVKLHAGKYLSEMKANPHDILTQTYEFEIILFENLWDMIEASLERKKMIA